MKKEKKSYKKMFVFLLVFTMGLFLHILLTNKIKDLTVQKNNLEIRLSGLKDKIEEHTVETQRLTSEKRITEYAENKLGLIRSEKPFEKIMISKSKVLRIKKIVERKYE